MMLTVCAPILLFLALGRFSLRRRVSTEWSTFTDCGVLGETLVQLGKGNETKATFALPITFDAACASAGQSTGL